MSKQTDYRDLFLTEATLAEHVTGYEIDIERYIATYMLLLNSDVHMDHRKKELVLSTLLIFKNEGAINWLFSKPFWTILDVRNVIRRLWTTKGAKQDKWLRKLMRNGRRIKTSRRDMLNYQIERMDSYKIERSILRHSYDAWREVIDYLHIPEKDFPDYTGHISAEYYLRMDGTTDERFLDEDKLIQERFLKPHSPLMKTIMDGTWPPTHFINTMRSVTHKNAVEVLNRYPTEFHYLRNKINFEKSPDVALAYLQKCHEVNIIRWYNELWFPSTMEMIATRLIALPKDKMIHLPYTTFFDLLYMNQTMKSELFTTLVERADRMTSRFNLPFPKPGLIAVDQSSSMSIDQVKIGTVIANLIGLQLDADLVYFYGGGWSYGRGRTRDGWVDSNYTYDGAVAQYEDIPLGTRGAVRLIDEHQPSGNTPIAQIMARYMTAAGHLIDGVKRIKTLVLVTDEGENSSWGKYNLASALEKYRTLTEERIEVLIVAIQSDDITVTRELKAHGFDVIRYRIDSVRDIESLFAMIAANTPAFLYDSVELTKLLRAKTHQMQSQSTLEGTKPNYEVVYMEADLDLKKYKKVRDDVFASVIKGTCANCGANLPIKDVNRFRFGETIKCPACDFTLAPTLFGATHVPQ